MKKFEGLFVVLTVICAAVFSVSTVLTAQREAGLRENEREVAAMLTFTAQETARPMEEAEAGYLLKEYNGRICVYYGDGSLMPAFVTEIETAGMRSADRELLKNGVPAADREELLGLLEDFGS